MVCCDMCNKKIGNIYIIDNDLILCPECFLKLYRNKIEETIGVEIATCSLSKKENFSTNKESDFHDFQVL